MNDIVKKKLDDAIAYACDGIEELRLQLRLTGGEPKKLLELADDLAKDDLPDRAPEELVRTKPQLHFRKLFHRIFCGLLCDRDTSWMYASWMGHHTYRIYVCRCGRVVEVLITGD